MVKAHAYGRVGLFGNPSDIYGGKCISFTINRQAQVVLQPSNHFEIKIN